MLAYERTILRHAFDELALTRTFHFRVKKKRGTYPSISHAEDQQEEYKFVKSKTTSLSLSRF